MNKTEAIRMAQDAGVQLIYFAYCDNGGIIRGKSTHVSTLDRRIDSGIGLSVAMQAVSDMDILVPVEGMGPAGEVRIIPDANTFTVLPFAPTRASMMCDLLKLNQIPWEACTRSYLKRMIDKAQKYGMEIMAAFEPEWSLATKEGDNYLPLDDSLSFSSIGTFNTLAVVDEIVSALEAQNIRVELYHPELGHGQQELSVRHTDALRAADNQLRYRDTVRAVSLRHGLYASLAPKPFADQAGNGAHIHFSAWDTDLKENLFYDPQSTYSLSKIAGSFMAGVLEHLPGLIALTCPSVNSYRRLTPSAWSSGFVCYGADNREAAIRIPSPYWGNEMASANLEFKPSDSSCNPYLALGSLIAAGLDGIDRGLSPKKGQLVDVDPSRLTDDERKTRGISRLPATLGEAIESLEGDEVLKQALGPVLAKSYLAVRKSDWDLFSNEDEAFELKHHFYKF